MVSSDGGGCPTEGFSKRDFGRRTGEEATDIWQSWKEEVSSGRLQRQVLAGDRAETLETVNSQVSGGPRGETTWDHYSGTGMGNAQVVV